MALAAGSRIGSYEVVGPLGAGGMGQVYRAKDTQLGRDVAIKALPDSLARDPERVARFQREAQVLAALHHPNIAGLHGLQEAGGSQYLVLEFVEGTTLGDHIAKAAATGKGMPLAEVLPLARQIIDALEAAHEKGIVHRDLKPANIMITGDGQAKVLDFGLARVVESDPTASTTNSPTLTMAATQAGLILGTAAYMSPEQAKGRVADKRSDVWAFGCVLYEMLAGKRIFEGEDVSETLAAVLRADPDWTGLPADLPGGIRTLLLRCLDRDRKTRIPDMAVVRYLLQDTASLASASGAAAAPARGPARFVGLGAAFTGGIAVTALGVWAIAAWAPAPPAPQVMRFAFSPPAAQRLAPTIADRQVAISPDGKFMAYISGASSAGGQLMVRPIDSLDATPIAGVVGARSPFFSHDGKWIGYFGSSDIRKVSTAGGPSVPLCPIDGPPRGGTWLSDDTIVFATGQPGTGLQRVPSGGGTPTNLTTPALAQGESDHIFPSALPDGRGVLFTVASTGAIATAQVAVLDLDTNTQTSLIRGGYHAEYVEPGYLVYATANALQGVAFDAARRRVMGDAVPVHDDVAITVSGASQFVVSRSGVLLYVPAAILSSAAGGGSNRTIVWMNRQGREEPLKVPPRAYFALRLSPDGTRIALDIRDQENDIWVWDLARTTLTRFTFDPVADLFPVWTRDSRRILWASARAGAFNLYWQAADGTGSPERLSEAPYGQYAMSVTADGKGVLINDLKAAQNPDVSLVPFEGKGPPVPILESAATERGADISPDGRFIAYESDESKTSEVFVRPFPNVNEGKWQVSIAGGSKPAWSPNGRELFYIDGASNLMAVSVQMTPTLERGNPVKLFEARNIATLASARFYDVSRDGQRFVMIKELPPPPGQSTIPTGPTFVVVLNWPEELKAKLK